MTHGNLDRYGCVYSLGTRWWQRPSRPVVITWRASNQCCHAIRAHGRRTSSQNTLERRDKRLRFVQNIIANVAVLPVDSRVAEIHANIIAMLSQSGSTIGAHDNWIAATAITYDYDLLTTNAAEFRRVPDLRVIDYLAQS